jgi:predicted nucleic acid-binding protein
LANKLAVYWDSCVWLRLINGEPGADLCESILERAKHGEVAIWTSSLTLAEVFKFKCDGPKSLPQEQDELFEKYIDSEFVVEVQVDHAVATVSRRLCRKFGPPIGPLKKPNDGVHLASAVINNLDEFHTFDADDLLKLDGKVLRQDGTLLKICLPHGPAIGQNLPLDLKPT